MLTYAEALEALSAAERFGIHPSLDGIRALTGALERPQDAYAAIQVTGTNGKSSTTRMIEALLEAHGVRAGAYTSPELESMTERVEIAGAPVSESDFAQAIAAARLAETDARETGALTPESTITQFELLTAAALWLFRERHVEVACLEVGMGGRWDATSIVSPRTSVITGVGLDHVEHLGRTREAIAEDKSHIIKPGATAVLGPGAAGVEDIFLRRADEVGASVVAVREAADPTPVAEARTVRFDVVTHSVEPGGHTTLRVRGMLGDYGEIALAAPAYQAPNAAAAIAAAEAYLGRALDAHAVCTALAGMSFPGRFELLASSPPLVIDGAHNPQAAAVLADAVCEAWPDPARRPQLLLGILADKDARGIVRALAPVMSSIAVTRSRSPRALEPGSLATMVRDITGTQPDVFASVDDALCALVGAYPAGLVVSGSITTAAEAWTWARQRAEAV
jgi:dihydrofolate synthase / folylpolyglutamate synthase